MKLQAADGFLADIRNAVTGETAVLERVARGYQIEGKSCGRICKRELHVRDLWQNCSAAKFTVSFRSDP